ncbi:MAG: transcriptional regulator [Pirellulales bacterium]
MKQTHRSEGTKPKDLPSDFQELVLAIDGLPSEQKAPLLGLVDRVVASTRRRRKILTLVQDALSQLRLDMKYLMFDLDATRRERDDYRARLEQDEDEL